MKSELILILCTVFAYRTKCVLKCKFIILCFLFLKVIGKERKQYSYWLLSAGNESNGYKYFMCIMLQNK